MQHPADLYKAGAVTAGDLITAPAVTVTPDADTELVPLAAWPAGASEPRSWPAGSTAGGPA